MPIGILGITFLSLIAATAHDDTPRQARAHVHGTGEAFVLLEGNSLFIQIAAPAANFRTPSGTVLSVPELNELDLAETFVNLPARARCSFSNTTVEQESLEGDHSHERADHEHEHEHEGHDHEHDHHDESSEHEHSDHHDHDDDHMTEHANFLVTLEGNCEHPNRLDSVNFEVFDSLPGFENLQTTFMTDNGADARTLTESAATISRP